MFLIVGLGNPGREHEHDRHNLGFVVVDALRDAQRWPDFRPKFAGLWTRGALDGHAVALLKPLTYMNRSGESAQPAAAYLRVSPDRIVVVHDELDLPWGDVRLKVGGGHAGNNGVRSVMQHLSTPEFLRVRVGIGKPPPGFRGEGADWVLSRFEPGERAQLSAVADRAVNALRLIVTQGPAAAMNAINTRSARGSGSAT